MIFMIIQSNVFSQEKYLMVLDIQDTFIKNKPYEESAKVVIDQVNTLIGSFDKGKVIYVKSAGKSLVISLKGFSTDTFPAPVFDSRLNIVNDHIFIKVSTGNAFESEELINFLKKNEVRDIVLTGLLAEKCIYQTALGGQESGYKIYIIPEAVVGKSEKSKGKAFGKLKRKGIEFIPIMQVISTCWASGIRAIF